MTTPSPTPTRRGGPPAILFVLAVVGLLAGVGVTLLSALGAGTPPSASAPPPSTGAAASQTVQAVIDALGAASLQSAASQRPYRPAESPALATAPRSVIQVVLPDDPGHGYIVVYELPSQERAVEAGQEAASYLAAGPGRIQFPTDTRFTLRQVGRTLVFFDWSPTNWPDPRSPAIQQALETLGTGIPVSS
jgi:hypothetical protein